ncbi:MAG: transcription termination factor Rho [Caldilineaceae bacterium]|nr:transcription termination factor Rho [Caldilineaceae bacterium]
MPQSVSGVLACLPRGGGFLRDPSISFQPVDDDPFVPAQLQREYGLVEGATVQGTIQPGKKGPQLVEIESICGLTPEQFRARTRFERLVAVNPSQRFRLGDSGDASMRVLDLIAPIGKGTRGLIVAPPKAGKTQILEGIANAIHAAEPETRVILLLVDERPEEVTHFRRHVQGEVLASSNDQSLDAHIKLAELTMAHIRCELECGRHVVVLVDSMTRLVRAFNLQGAGARRTLSGGLDAKAMEIPRRFFGLARAIENGGSVTVLGTALIETGSRLDDYVFEELKSTGNSEIVLDRSLAEARIFPAVNILASGTRKEELLYSEEETQRLIALRRWLSKGTPKAAMVGLLSLLEKAPTNDELLRRIKPA